MRLKNFDNELTITFIHNLLKFVSEIEYENLTNLSDKKQYEEEERKRREVKFQKDLEAKKGSTKLSKK